MQQLVYREGVIAERSFLRRAGRIQESHQVDSRGTHLKWQARGVSAVGEHNLRHIASNSLMFWA